MIEATSWLNTRWIVSESRVAGDRLVLALGHPDADPVPRGADREGHRAGDAAGDRAADDRPHPGHELEQAGRRRPAGLGGHGRGRQAGHGGALHRDVVDVGDLGHHADLDRHQHGRVGERDRREPSPGRRRRRGVHRLLGSLSLSRGVDLLRGDKGLGGLIRSAAKGGIEQVQQSVLLDPGERVGQRVDHDRAAVVDRQPHAPRSGCRARSRPGRGRAARGRRAGRGPGSCTRITGRPTPASSRMNAASVSSKRRSVARTQYHARWTCSANGIARLLSMNRVQLVDDPVGVPPDLEALGVVDAELAGAVHVEVAARASPVARCRWRRPTRRRSR